MIRTENLAAKMYNYITEWHKRNNFVYDKIDNSLEDLINLLVRYNYELWHQEDIARDPAAKDAEIAQVKRNIDKLNQKRNDMIEKVDEKISEILSENKITFNDNATMNSETPGSIIDRLSINMLKIYHMKEQTERSDASGEHIESCKQKLAVLEIQQKDLSTCLNELIDDLKTGKKYFKVYRQMKMYNDPNLNPVLYAKNND